LPALSQLSGDEFVTLVQSQTDKDTLTVVFVERSLSVEDLSQCKLKTQTCFENLRKVEDKTYLTAVQDPVAALESSVGKQKQKSILLSNEGDLSEKVDAAGSEKLLFVYLDQAESKEDFAKHGKRKSTSCDIFFFVLC
jgi:V-type H+-transporting ATPase S1 subunit